MIFSFINNRISDIYYLLPQNYRLYDEEMIDSYSTRNQRIKRNMGYGKRYVARDSSTISMFFVDGLSKLISKKIIDKKDIGAIVTVTFCPDSFSPGVSGIVHGEIGLEEDIISMDLNDGCAGFLTGLIQSGIILDRLEDNKKVVLLNGDVVNRISSNSKKLYSDPPYGGDGASITVLEKSENNCGISSVLRTCGKMSELVSMRTGAFFDPYGLDSRVLQKDPGAAFRFFQEAIPRCVNDLCLHCGINLDEIKGISSVQANSLSVKKMAEKLSFPYDEMPYDLVEQYGDSSDALNVMGLIKLFDKHSNDICGNYITISYGAGLRYGASIISFDDEVRYGIIDTDL